MPEPLWTEPVEHNCDIAKAQDMNNGDDAKKDHCYLLLVPLLALEGKDFSSSVELKGPYGYNISPYRYLYEGIGRLTRVFLRIGGTVGVRRGPLWPSHLPRRPHLHFVIEGRSWSLFIWHLRYAPSHLSANIFCHLSGVLNEFWPCAPFSRTQPLEGNYGKWITESLTKQCRNTRKEASRL